MKAAEKRENARKTENSRAFGGRFMKRLHAPKPVDARYLNPEYCILRPKASTVCRLQRRIDLCKAY